MKLNLGSLILFLLSTLLCGEDFSHNFTLNNSTPYLQEPILLKLELKQTNHKIVLLFNFDLEKSEDYSFQRVDRKKEGKNHFAYREYTYLIYPLKTGKVKLNFKLKKRVTTDDSILYSYSGDRDNVKGLVEVDSDIALEPITIDVKPLPKGVEMVGDFKLDFKFKTHKTEAYRAIPFKLTLKGDGYPPKLKNILISDSNISIFKEEPIIKSTSSLKGTESTSIYSMAISNDKSFLLKKREIKGFNPKTDKTYTLSIPEQNFTVEKIEIDKLIDKEDSPKSAKMELSWINDFLSYILIFIAGYLTALTVKWQDKSKSTKEDRPLHNRIKNSKNARELLQILISEDNSTRFSRAIEELEDILYNGSRKDFKDIKMELEKEMN